MTDTTDEQKDGPARVRPFADDPEWCRFVSKLVLGDCWEWSGAHDDDGYGQFRLSANGRPGKVIRTHQYTYERLVGPVPTGLELDHLCRNHGCANPDHLEPVTHAENMRRSPIQGIGLPTGQAARRAITHCPQNHPYDEANTGRRPRTGHRYCRACARERMRRYNRKEVTTV